jgi:hypothetical protein
VHLSNNVTSMSAQPPFRCLQNVVFALSNAATKGSTAARKALTALGLDRRLPQASWAAAGGSHLVRQRLRWEQEAGLLPGTEGSSSNGGPAAASAAASHGGGTLAVLFSPKDDAFDVGQPSGDGGLLGALLAGVVGLAAEPVRGFDEGERMGHASLTRLGHGLAAEVT